jgi:putative transposase
MVRYIEANSLRAGLVEDLKDYPWSSYHVHGLGSQDPLLSVLPGWENLAATEQKRQGYWRRLVHEPVTERELAALRRSVTSGRPYGSEGWVKGMASALGLPLQGRPRGRPRKHPSASTAEK